MRRWLALSVLLGVACLAGAAWLTGPAWVDALLACFFFAGISLGLGAGIIVRRFSHSWAALAGLLLGVGAAAGRFALLASVTVRPHPVVGIAIPEIPLALGTVAWGGLALVWGAWGMTTLIEAKERPPRWRLLVVSAAAAVALGLYSLAPLGFLLGLRVNHWTVLGLFFLALVAHGAGRLVAKLTARRR